MGSKKCDGFYDESVNNATASHVQASPHRHFSTKVATNMIRHFPLLNVDGPRIKIGRRMVRLNAIPNLHFSPYLSPLFFESTDIRGRNILKWTDIKFSKVWKKHFFMYFTVLFFLGNLPCYFSEVIFSFFHADGLVALSKHPIIKENLDPKSSHP